MMIGTLLWSRSQREGKTVYFRKHEIHYHQVWDLFSSMDMACLPSLRFVPENCAT
ncbi:hypothetical protein [Candidatus Villigracilis saccharophilus]|uniref:hypothetical protein n=1 Tax=Candidatus Villigracilis saccharophilus TaxID=3140684 RepID=UPI0031F199A2